MGACSALGITNQDALSEDLENDPFLNSALQRCTCELYYRFGSFLAPLSVGIINNSAKRGLTQFWELFTMIPCTPKYLKR